MKRKETVTKESTTKPKKGRTSIGEVVSPTSTLEEQKRRAKEWYENEEKKKMESAPIKSSAKAVRSTSPTSKTPSKKAKVVAEEEPAPRSTRKSTRATETPANNKILSAKVEVEWAEDFEDEEEESEEEVPVVKQTAAQLLEEQKKKAKEWYENEEKKKLEAAVKARKTPVKAVKVESAKPTRTYADVVATKPRAVTPTLPLTAEALQNRTSSSNKNSPFAHPIVAQGSAAKCPFSAEPERENLNYDHQAAFETQHSVADDSCELCGVTVALAAVPLVVIGYYDPKIAVTTLVILFVVSVLRRLFRLIGVAETSI